MAGEDPTRDPSHDLRVGSYRVIRSLGSGGMSSVFLADHPETGVEVALKILPRTLAKNPTLLERFLREARSAEALEHPNIVAIYDRGVDEGRHYLVLEYVTGGDLHEWVRDHGPMAIPEAVAVIRSVAEGLRFAAGVGLIHRDIKPANLLIDAAGLVKIADLGLALRAESEDERVTREGTTVGTVDYMAPEQARDSRATSIRSDIYSLGCTFYFLLAGKPPYPGGDVVDKLTRHCTAPAPDARDLRPDVPAELAHLLLKMLAKRPEQRYQNYDDFIASLDALPVHHTPFATIIADAPDALIDEEEDEANDPRGVAVPLALPGAAAGDRDADGPRLDEISFEDLRDVEDPEGHEPPGRHSSKRPEPAGVLAPPGMFDTAEFGVEQPSDGGEVVLPGRGMSQSERAWLVTSCMGGLALVAFVIGVHQLVRVTTRSQTPVEDAVGVRDDVPEAVVKVDPPVPHDPAPRPVATRPVVPAVPAPASTPPPWVEPTDPASEVVAEVDYGPDFEARFRPDWAAGEVTTHLPGKDTTVRRIPDPQDPDQKATLRAALDVIGGGTIEVTGNGPFFEDDLRMLGETRLIRAQPGFRPIVCVESPKLSVVRQQTAFVILENRALVLDGLDLIVDTNDLPRHQTALFLCRGGALTLRNCTLTVVNRRNFPLAIIQTGPADRPSRIRLEGTFVRGNVSSLVELQGGPSDVYVSRSVLLNGQGSAFAVSSSGPLDRRVFVSRTVVATAGPAFLAIEPPPGVHPRPMIARVLGSTFAHFQTGTRPGLISCRLEALGAGERVNWQGDFNTFSGWHSWVSDGTSPGGRLASLAEARSVWAGTDPGSVETLEAWPHSTPADRITPRQVRDLEPNRADVLTRVASPSPWLLQKSVESFPHPMIPAIVPPGATAPGVREVTFATQDASFRGDLGRFLAGAVKPDDSFLRVRVSGAGRHEFTPVKMPDGVSLEIVVVPNPSGQSPSWTTTTGASGDALIDVPGGSLALSGLSLTRDGSARLGALVQVRSGHLVVHRCRLTSTGTAEPGGGRLISFLAPGSRPLKVHLPGPFGATTDRPTCRVIETAMMSVGDAITAEVGRGLVAFEQSAVVAGQAAFHLIPSPVARSRFEADLVLDHCTIASESAFVLLGSWEGGDAGPDRPWLVSTHKCAYFASYQRLNREGVLLRADAGSFARGTLFWQATGDAFEVESFTATEKATPPPNRRPDVSRQWSALWGEAHFHAVTGVHPPQATPSARLRARLKPGKVEPGDLAIDRSFPAGNPPAPDLGVDLSRLLVPATDRGARIP